MPTILFIYGWILYFYSNESQEPIHIHAQKGDAQAKFWILIDEDLAIHNLIKSSSELTA